MNYKTNRQNHDFQIAYFLAGSCHTPDAAYALLQDLRDDRLTALKMVEASAMRTMAKAIRAYRVIDSLSLKGDVQDELLDAKADLSEIDAFSELDKKNVAAAQAELDFIDKCIATVQPLRKYKDLPDAQAHEAAQREEWKLELIYRAENFLLTTGTIPPDDFAHMRMHPDFKDDIAPMIKNIGNRIESARGRNDLMVSFAEKDNFNLPLLLENSLTF